MERTQKVYAKAGDRRKPNDRLTHISEILPAVLGKLACGYCATCLIDARTVIPIEAEGLSLVFCRRCGMPHDVPGLLPARVDDEPEPVASCDRAA